MPLYRCSNCGSCNRGFPSSPCAKAGGADPNRPPRASDFTHVKSVQVEVESNFKLTDDDIKIIIDSLEISAEYYKKEIIPNLMIGAWGRCQLEERVKTMIELRDKFKEKIQ